MTEPKVEIPMSREAVLDWIGHAMRDRAYPEFHAAPLPLWATDAAESILRFFEQNGKVVTVDDETADWCSSEDHPPHTGECPDLIHH